MSSTVLYMLIYYCPGYRRSAVAELIRLTAQYILQQLELCMMSMECLAIHTMDVWGGLPMSVPNMMGSSAWTAQFDLDAAALHGCPKLPQ